MDQKTDFAAVNLNLKIKCSSSNARVKKINKNNRCPVIFIEFNKEMKSPRPSVTALEKNLHCDVTRGNDTRLKRVIRLLITWKIEQDAQCLLFFAEGCNHRAKHAFCLETQRVFLDFSSLGGCCSRVQDE